MRFEMFGQAAQPVGMFRKAGAGIVFEKNIIVDDGCAEYIRLRFCIFGSNHHERSKRQQRNAEKKQGVDMIPADHFFWGMVILAIFIISPHPATLHLISNAAKTLPSSLMGLL